MPWYVTLDFCIREHLSVVRALEVLVGIVAATVSASVTSYLPLLQSLLLCVFWFVAAVFLFEMIQDTIHAKAEFWLEKRRD